MSETIRPLLDRIDILNQIREDYDVSFQIAVVPMIYGGNGESDPCLAPSLEVMEFCVATQTKLDIDMYFFCEEDERLGREEMAREDEQRAKELAKKSLGDIIREYRLKNGMTQEALAAALFVTPQAISKWEKGQSSPDINLLLSLAKTLQIGVDQLLGGDRR
jgi:DNA-binding XRE family transcriptional regulator